MSTGVSRNELHWILWDRRAANDTVRVQQNQMCEGLDVTRYTLNRILQSMCEEGRLRKLTTKGGAAVKTYLVADPETWQPTLDDNEMRRP